MEASATSNRDRDGALDADDSDSAVQRFKVEPNLSDFEDEDVSYFKLIFPTFIFFSDLQS